MSGFSSGVLEALEILLAIYISIARYWPENDFWLLVSFEGLARPFRRVW